MGLRPITIVKTYSVLIGGGISFLAWFLFFVLGIASAMSWGTLSYDMGFWFGFAMIVTICAAWVAYGVWTMQPWARYPAMILLVIAFLFLSFLSYGLVENVLDANLDAILFIPFVLGAIVSGYGVWFFAKNEQARKMFRRRRT